MEDNQQTQSTFGVEEFKSFMETEEGRKILNPMFDSRVSKGIETWKSNNLEKLVNEELVKQGFIQTEEQKQMMSLKQEIENMKREKMLADLNGYKLSELSNIGLPASLGKYIHGESEESIRESITGLKELFDSSVAEAVKKKLANTGGKLEDIHEQPQVPQNTDITKMSYSERAKLKAENPKLFAQLMGL